MITFLKLHIPSIESHFTPLTLTVLNSIGLLQQTITWYKNPPCSEQVHSYPTRFSVAGSFHIKQARTNHQLFSFSRVGAKIWNGIPPELRELRKAPFKRKLTHLLLKILETEEMNVDMRYIDLSSFCLYVN